MNRRSFVGLLTSGAAALGVKQALPMAPALESLNTPAPPTSDSRGKISIRQYTSETFSSRVGEVFAFHRTAAANDSAIQLELVSVQSSPHRPAVGARQSFSLLFVLRSDDATRESALHLRHDEFEPCAWFVNRVAAPERERHVPYYEAVFG
jgi:hypothetical protein